MRATHLAELRETIRGLSRQGLVDEELHRSQLSGFSFDLPSGLPAARSVVIVAVPAPQVRVTVRWNHRRVAVIVPPTYAGYSATTAAVERAVAEAVAEDGYRVATALLPLKTLAVRSGLAVYGRNNLCYVPGMGSFLQLAGVLTDMPCAEDSWRDARALPRCDTCIGCERQCPTGAVATDRFLLRAERCLTYHNEAAADFPAWINPRWHHCLIGCMRCQTVCPENKAVLARIEDRAEFSEAETALLVGDGPFDRLPSDTARKLIDLQLNETPEILRRNLRALLRRSTRQD